MPGSEDSDANSGSRREGRMSLSHLLDGRFARLTTRFPEDIEGANFLDRHIIMTGTTRTTAELDPRRRRTLFRAWHRGIREMDLIFGQFADNELAGLSEDDLNEFEGILSEDDNDLFKWICGEQAPAGAAEDAAFCVGFQHFDQTKPFRLAHRIRKMNLLEKPRKSVA
jgi:succinate dehydrogenase flavin-adding protein (antitoxin of CptAB toxin-antitoxin module)